MAINMNSQGLLALNGVVIAAAMIMAARKYKTFFTPVTLFGAYFFVSSVLSPWLFLELKLLLVPKAAVNYTIVLSCLYFAAFAVAYLARLSPLRSPLEFLIRVSRPFAMENGRVVSALAIGLLIAEFLALYLTLAVASGAGWMWISDTREAYQLYRAGVGVWWSLAQATLMLAFLMSLFRWGTTWPRVVLQALAFSSAAFFLGSKSFILAYPVIGAFYAHFVIRRIRVFTFTLCGALLLAGFVVLQLVQGTAETIADAIRYFDYFAYSARFLDSFRHHAFFWGQITLSDLWWYVPRGLYPAKPFVYGQNSLLRFLFPGFEATVRRTGFTPGMLPWSMGYADFGVPGVIAAGVLAGWISKAVFERFLLRRDLLSLALVVQLGFVNFIVLFSAAPFPLFWGWLVIQGFFLWLLSAPAAAGPVRKAGQRLPPQVPAPGGILHAGGR
ncbi:MAG TPA: hypothetical protein VKV05_04830 [Terriglobales bacterium]|nr:hypothetical protein [Terriglobales bacterium]